MAKPTIVTRAGKGSALTWTEGDANLTNLRDATITVTDGSNSKALDLNSTLTFTAGTNVTLSVNSSTGAVTINSSQPTSVATLTTPRAIYGNNFDGSAALTQIIASTYGGTGNGFSKFSGPATSEKTFTLPNSNATLLYDGGALGTPSSGTVTNLTGTASININGTVGATTAAAGTFTALTANTSASLKGITEGAIYDLGTTGGTIAPNVANGNVQKITLNAALTLNAFTSPVAGQSLTLIITGGTAYTSITSTMKFAGGIKTLTATASCIDIVSVYYDGTNYYASLAKGFA
jgi:hypothetical protein